MTTPDTLADTLDQAGTLCRSCHAVVPLALLVLNRRPELWRCPECREPLSPVSPASRR